MLTTSSYMGCMKGKYNYLFFLLVEEYIARQKALSESIEGALGVFARNLGDKGVVFVPFSQDEDKTKNEILSKNWDEYELRAPGLLLIGEDFANFDPHKSSDNWIYIPLEGLMDTSRVAEFRILSDFFNDLTKACENNIEISDLKRHLKKRNLANRTKKVFGETQIQFGPIATTIDAVKEAINICLDCVKD